MMRLFLAAFVAAASPAMAETLPVPPVPPDQAAVGESAPVPNVNARPPITVLASKPSVDVRFYRANNFDTSKGFAPGSRFQTSEDRKPIQTPGLSVTVPLD